MNYFAHGRAWLDDPYYLAGTAVPDWLNVSDRGVRVRARQAAAWIDDADPPLAALARGIVQHHHDDAWFHDTAAFNELQWRLAAMIRATLGPDDSLRPSFLGHVLVEVLLDAALVVEEPSLLDDYYAAMAAVDAATVERGVNRMAARPCARLAWFIEAFSAERFLYDYADDGKLWFRMNQVMRRVGLPALPENFTSLLPEARRLVTEQRHRLTTAPLADAMPLHSTPLHSTPSPSTTSHPG
ncbi:MAG TPA: hypothetical protein VHZ24_02790 [Pirellulales bacterium]|jgi:hypothetical protein|nr:hypothetical protein [Pirellulales bacterium]